MDQGNAERNEQSQKSMYEQAADAIAEAIRQIEASNVSAEKKAEQKEALAKEALNLFKENAETVKKYQEQEKKGEDLSDDQKKEQKEASENLNKAVAQASTLADKDVAVVQNDTARRILRELSKTPLTESETADAQEVLGKYFLGDDPKDIVIGKKGEQKSDFQKDAELLKSINESAAEKINAAIIHRAQDLGYKPNELREIINPIDNAGAQSEQEAIQEQMEHERRRQFENIGVFEKFTEKQMKFIGQLHDPEAFSRSVYREIYGKDTPEGEVDKAQLEKITEKKKHIEATLRKHYEKRNLPIPVDLNEKVEHVYLEEVSGEISGRVLDVMNHLYLQLQQERPDKFFEDITREDFMRGITTTQLAITAAVRKLAVNLGEAEKDPSNPLHKIVKDIHLIREAEVDDDIAQRRKLIARGDKMEEIELNYPWLKPLPYGKEVNLSSFVEYMNVGLINHWTHATEYFHNTRVMHNHPPGEKGFYSQLGGYAEHLKGTDIDELLLLPDGQIVLQAYHLYDKLLEEDLAKKDWKVSAYQFANKLEETSTRLENEVRQRLKLLYPDKTKEQLIGAVNTAIGIARGMLLTEPEKNAFSDPVDPEGGGFYASYATNDAGSLTVFNPLHVNLRWQGEHMLPMFYFMDIEGGGRTWNHNKMWENAKLYMDSVRTGKRSSKLPEKLFIDQMVDIINVGGPAKRRGWRLLHSLQDHYKHYERTVTKDGKTFREDAIDPLESFKAMEMIGYEAIFNFIDNKKAGTTILNAREGTPEAAKRNEWFEYLYKRYFYEGDIKNYSRSDFENYIKKIKVLGEKAALNHVKKEGSYSAGSEVAQIEAETSQIFLDRFILREIAARFPSKLLRMDRNRYHEDGISRWRSIELVMREKNGWDINKFDYVMKDLSFAEMLLRQEMSKIIRERVKIQPNIGLNEFEDIDYRLSPEKITKLLRQLKNGKGERTVDEDRIKDVLDLYDEINERIIHGRNKETGERYLDGPCLKDVKNYTFTFGIEDTDISLMAWRATGPRMTARAIKDTGSFEADVVPWIIDAPKLLNQIAISGKHDFSPIIEYLRKAQKAFQMVHGTGPDHKFVYQMASMIIQYFKKDTNARGLLGILQMASKKPHSIAAEYAGRSSAVWEWDARDIDRFIVALESNALLPKLPYNKQEGPKEEDRYFDFWGLLKKPIKIGKRIKEDYPHNAYKLRKRFGADWAAIGLEVLNSVLPIVAIYILWQYISKATEEAEGKKK